MKATLSIVLLSCLLTGCSAAGYLADKGNQYCAVRADSMDSVIDGINQRLAEEGARFKVNGITCLP